MIIKMLYRTNSTFPVKSLAEARSKVLEFRGTKRSSSFGGGIVYDDSGNFVCKFSYNGRCWDNENWNLAKEIIIK